MVTAEEIGEIKVFADLTPEQLERLSRAAADISLSTGEYAVHEAGERAIFAVLSGKIEAVKTTDGIEKPVGARLPGDIFGEVPIALGTVFPVGFRAAEPSRVMRLEATDYHAVAAVVPDVAKQIGRLAAHRMSGARGLQGIAADPPKPRATVIGERHESTCSGLRRFLDRNQISYEWITADTPSAAEDWGAPVPSAAELPTIRLESGETLMRPGHRRVADLLGLDTEADLPEYDTVIVGGGPAGLAAAVYGASEGLRTLVVEREAPGGQAGTSSRIENYLGFPAGVSGDELAGRALLQARRHGAEILVTRRVERIDAPTRQIHLDGGEVLNARTIILACGVSWRRLPIEGLDALVGKGVSYGAARSDAPATHGLDVQIIGAGNSAGQAALHTASHARRVTILCRGSNLEKSMSQYLIDQLATGSNIDVRFGAEVAGVHGEGALEQIEVLESATGERSRMASGGLFIFIGADAETGWLPEEIALDRRGFVLTGNDLVSSELWSLDRDPYLLETSVPGIFACGDVRFSPVKRVAAAVGEGSMAIAFVHQFLKDSSSP